HPMERALLEAYADALVEHLNHEARARLFTGARARIVLDRLLSRRLNPTERAIALRALGAHAQTHDSQRRRMLEWTEAVAAVSGHPVWDSRELFWLDELRAAFHVH
ncbi:MAG: hypothetical protein JNK82_28830, partial [Myxococcaceae bacterium]|nr:hypothetical protein [Myxococcaceae bacterium]